MSEERKVRDIEWCPVHGGQKIVMGLVCAVKSEWPHLYDEACHFVAAEVSFDPSLVAEVVK